MNTIDQFINRYRAQLQHYLDDDTRIIENHGLILDFVDTVLDDWDSLHGEPLLEYTREEMTFWFCLYKLESVSEIPPDLPIMPFEEMMFVSLRQIREALRTGNPLPDEYHASRPGFIAGDTSDDTADGLLRQTP